MKRSFCLCVPLLLWSALSVAQAPFGQQVIESATINYSTNTITIVGQGFCALGRQPSVFFGQRAPWQALRRFTS
jgi:hypothetical protein